jgi:hypothetical protein
MDISTYSFDIFEGEIFSDDKFLIKEFICDQSSLRDELRINISMDKDERKKFNLNLKNLISFVF